MIDRLIERYPILKACQAEIEKAAELLIRAYENERTVLVCGNGGSCADADHIVGELMKGFCNKRALNDAEKSMLSSIDEKCGASIADGLQKALPAINLCAQSAVLTAYGNDVNPKLAFAQLAYGYVKRDDILIGISTSGNSENVINAGIATKAKGAISIGLTGISECLMDRIFDCVIHVPEKETYKVQELHLPVYHWLCLEIENHFFAE